jgi:hypothetical protein
VAARSDVATDQQPDLEPIQAAKSGLVGCTSNMMTCIVGSGIVGGLLQKDVLVKMWYRTHGVSHTSLS